MKEALSPSIQLRCLRVKERIKREKKIKRFCEARKLVKMRCEKSPIYLDFKASKNSRRSGEQKKKKLFICAPFLSPVRVSHIHSFIPFIALVFCLFFAGNAFFFSYSYSIVVVYVYTYRHTQKACHKHLFDSLSSEQRDTR